MPYSSLPPLLEKIPRNPFCEFGYVETNGGDRICTFEEILQLGGNNSLYLELWDDSAAFIREVDNLLLRYRRTEDVIWGNRFNNVIRQNCTEIDGGIPTVSTSIQWILIHIAYYTGILPFLPRRYLNFDIFNTVLISPKVWSKLFSGSLRFSEENSRRAQKSFEYVFSLINFFLFCPRLWGYLKGVGVPVLVMGVNFEDEFMLAEGGGASAVITDYPERLRGLRDSGAKGQQGNSRRERERDSNLFSQRL